MSTTDKKLALVNMPTLTHRLGLFTTSEGGRSYVADFFKISLGRNDFTKYIAERLAADFACALSDGLCQLFHLAAAAPQAAADLSGAEQCEQCGAITARLNGDGCAKWCCHCGARLNGTYVSAGLSVPDGWKLVPVELTSKMATAFNHADLKVYAATNRAAYKGQHCWKAMLAVAPQPVGIEQMPKATDKDIERWQAAILAKPEGPWTMGNGGSFDRTAIKPISDEMLEELAMWLRMGYTPWNGSRLMPGDRQFMYLLYYSVQGLVSRMRIAERATQGVIGLMEALEQIQRWDGFPVTRKTWPKSGEPMSYGACYGSNGERDFMRGVANAALDAYRAQAQGGAK